MKRVADFLKSVYRGWMKVAHVIGKINTTVLLTVFYVIVIGIAKAVVFSARKDLLDERWRDRESYWKKRENFSARREDLLKPY